MPFAEQGGLPVRRCAACSQTVEKPLWVRGPQPPEAFHRARRHARRERKTLRRKAFFERKKAANSHFFDTLCCKGPGTAFAFARTRIPGEGPPL